MGTETHTKRKHEDSFQSLSAISYCTKWWVYFSKVRGIYSEMPAAHIFYLKIQIQHATSPSCFKRQPMTTKVSFKNNQMKNKREAYFGCNGLIQFACYRFIHIYVLYCDVLVHYIWHNERTKLIRIFNAVINLETFSSSPTHTSCFSLSLIPPQFGFCCCCWKF